MDYAVALSAELLTVTAASQRYTWPRASASIILIASATNADIVRVAMGPEATAIALEDTDQIVLEPGQQIALNDYWTNGFAYIADGAGANTLRVVVTKR